MKRSLIIISFVLVLLMAFSGAALAQGPDDVICGDLAEEDCEILVGSAEAMQEVASGVSEMSMDIVASGIPDAPFEELSLSLVSSSIYVVDPEITAEFVEIQHLTPDEMMQDMDEIMGLVLEFYGTTSSELDVTIFLGEEFAAAISEDSSGTPIPEVIPLSLVLVDGILYINIDELASEVPELAEMSGWFGVDVIELLSLSMDQAGEDMMSSDPSMNGFMLGMSMGNKGAFKEFVNVERLDDEEIAGQPAAVFFSSFDFGAFLASDAFRELVVTQMMMSGADETEVAEIEEALGMVGLVAPMLVTGIDAGSWQVIGLDDLYLYQSEMFFEWDLASLAALAAMGGDDSFDAENAPIIQFQTTTDNSDFGGEFDISAPEDAIIIPTEMVLEALAQ